MSSYLQLGGFNPSDFGLSVDPRLVLKTSEMASVGRPPLPPTSTVGWLSDGTVISLPDIYFCVCSDDSKVYVFNKNNEYILPYGKFRETVSHSDDVIPNPVAPATEVLRKVQIDDTVFTLNAANDLISAGAVPPTSETEGDVGHLYIDQSNPSLYQCTQLDNSTLFDDPGTPLPLNLEKGWKNLEVTGTEKILSNGGKPQADTEGCSGQLFVDTHACELYICKGYNDQSSSYIWEKVNKSTGFNLTIVSIDEPYSLLYADGTWSAPVGGQSTYENVVAFAIYDGQEVEVRRGLLSPLYQNIYDNKNGYTLVSDTAVIFEG